MPSWLHTKPNVVIDASSLVGALLKPDSTRQRAFDLARSRYNICFSSQVADEIIEVLRRPKFHRATSPERLAAFVSAVFDNALRFEPTLRVSDCTDPNDNMYLELALAADAEIVISSDGDLLRLNPWRGVPILKPAQFVATIETMQ